MTDDDLTAQAPEANLQHVREQIVDAVLIVGGIFGVLSVILSFITSLQVGLVPVEVGYSISLLIFVVSAIFRKRIPYRTKAMMLIITVYCVGLVNLIGWGLIGSNSIWFVLMVLLAMIFLDLRTGLIAYGAVVATLAVITMLMSIGALAFSVNFEAFAYSSTAWYSRTLIVILISAMLVVSIGRIIQALQAQLRRSQEAAAKLEQRTTELESEVHRREQAEGALAVAIEELEELDKLKDKFIDSVSHELRTPLANIQLYHQLAGMKPDKLPEYIETLNKETKRLNHIVEQLISASSVNYDLTLTTMVDVDVPYLISYLFKEQEDDLTRKGITLHLPPSSEAFITLAAPEHISRALANVVDNAVKYTNENGIIKVALTRTKQQNTEMIRLTINNTGICPPQNEHETIFTRFYRGANSLEMGVAGAGLGLSISRRIIEQYGGKISLTCEDSLITLTIDLLAVRPISEIVQESFPTDSVNH